MIQPLPAIAVVLLLLPLPAVLADETVGPWNLTELKRTPEMRCICPPFWLTMAMGPASKARLPAIMCIHFKEMMVRLSIGCSFLMMQRNTCLLRSSRALGLTAGKRA